jgi:hypothetical protein
LPTKWIRSGGQPALLPLVASELARASAISFKAALLPVICSIGWLLIDGLCRQC